MATPTGPISWSFIQDYIDSKIQELQSQIDNVAITMPIGHIFPVVTTIPPGCVICNGQTIKRSTYPKLVEWLTDKKIMVTDSAWNSTATANGGYCTKFSSGDGKSTIRLPKFAPFIEIGTDSTREDYKAAGLPNITGSVYVGSCEIQNPTGCFTVTNAGGWTGGDYHEPAQGTLYIDASRSSSAYGKSSTVQPESNVWVMVVQAA